jgi:hypothetical protein
MRTLFQGSVFYTKSALLRGRENKVLVAEFILIVVVPTAGRPTPASNPEAKQGTFMPTATKTRNDEEVSVGKANSTAEIKKDHPFGRPLSL